MFAIKFWRYIWLVCLARKLTCLFFILAINYNYFIKYSATSQKHCNEVPERINCVIIPLFQHSSFESFNVILVDRVQHYITQPSMEVRKLHCYYWITARKWIHEIHCGRLHFMSRVRMDRYDVFIKFCIELSV